MINKLFTTALYLWNPSYFVATVSENTEEQIRKYINNQKKQVK
ncbi:transposase [Clostridioides difficile]|nr:transposase [Clostridioides difficile]